MNTENRSMRQLWFDHVNKTRKKAGTKKDPCSHREAMKIASSTWPAIKTRIVKRRARDAKKKAQAAEIK